MDQGILGTLQLHTVMAAARNDVATYFFNSALDDDATACRHCGAGARRHHADQVAGDRIRVGGLL